MSTISALFVSNFKRLKKVEINPGARQIVVIGGRNAQGKSSALDAIAACLGGGRLLPASPIRNGEDKSVTVVTLDDGTTIKRTVTRKDDGKFGGSLTVQTADGMRPVGGAQAWLDRRIGATSVDPIAFMNTDAKAQAEAIRKIAGVDTSDIDRETREVYEERTAVGRNGKAAKGAVDSATRHMDVPDEVPEPNIVSVADVLDEVRAADETVQAKREAERVAAQVLAKAEAARSEAAAKSADIETVKAAGERAIQARRDDLARAQAALAAEVKRAEESEMAAKKAAELAAAAAAERAKQATAASEHAVDVAAKVIDPAPIRAKLSTIEADNDAERKRVAAIAQKVRENEAYAEKVARYNALREEYTAKSERLAELAQARAEVIAAGVMPVEGLSFDESGGLTFDDVPLSQASMAQKVRVSLAVALAQVPDDGIRVALIRDASLLDDDSMQLVADIAAEMNAQVWLERVGDHDDGAIVIEDGGVR